MKLWEILVPASLGKTRFSFEHHKAWDNFVRERAGGLTVFRAAKGQWVAPDGELFHDRMIPVRIRCDEKSLEEIVNFTARHYRQLAVMFYKISDEVHIRNFPLDSSGQIG